MTLGEKQRRFSVCVGHLLLEIHARGYACAIAWAYRPPECAEHLAKAGKGIRSSLHSSKLAIDLDLFSPTGEYLTDTESHRQFGEYWESLDEWARWGGRFRDGGHYSFQHLGVM